MHNLHSRADVEIVRSQLNTSCYQHYVSTINTSFRVCERNHKPHGTCFARAEDHRGFGVRGRNDCRQNLQGVRRRINIMSHFNAIARILDRMSDRQAVIVSIIGIAIIAVCIVYSI